MKNVTGFIEIDGDKYKLVPVEPERPKGLWFVTSPSDTVIVVEHTSSSHTGEMIPSDSERHAIKEAVAALVEFIKSQVDGGKTTTQKHDAFVALTKAAGQAHKIAGEPKGKK